MKSPACVPPRGTAKEWSSRLTPVAAAILIAVAGVPASGQSPTIAAKQATAFIGTWVIDIASPAALKGTETVRVWEKDGLVAASVQVGQFPPNEVTGLLRDGDLLVLSTTMRENGAPIWVVISLKVEGETMTFAQMMERSPMTVRGVGKKQQ